VCEGVLAAAGGGEYYIKILKLPDAAMILKIFSPKKIGGKSKFLTLNPHLAFESKLIHNVALYRKRHFFAENWRKTPKNVIITLTLVMLKKRMPDSRILREYVGIFSWCWYLGKSEDILRGYEFG
jgi:hypothetical protein